MTFREDGSNLTANVQNASGGQEPRSRKVRKSLVGQPGSAYKIFVVVVLNSKTAKCTHSWFYSKMTKILSLMILY